MNFQNAEIACRQAEACTRGPERHCDEAFGVLVMAQLYGVPELSTQNQYLEQECPPGQMEVFEPDGSLSLRHELFGGKFFVFPNGGSPLYQPLMRASRAHHARHPSHLRDRIQVQVSRGAGPLLQPLDLLIHEFYPQPAQTVEGCILSGSYYHIMDYGQTTDRTTPIGI